MSLDSPTPPSGWYNHEVNATFSVHDALDQAQVFYTVDGGNRTLFDGTAVPITGSAQHVVTYQAVDQAGNVEALHTAAVKIDTTTPVINDSNLPSTLFLVNGRVFLSATASDPISGVGSMAFLIDGRVIPGCVSDSGSLACGWDSTTSSDGFHTLTVVATSVAGLSSMKSIHVLVVNGVESVGMSYAATDNGGNTPFGNHTVGASGGSSGSASVSAPAQSANAAPPDEFLLARGLVTTVGFLSNVLTCNFNCGSAVMTVTVNECQITETVPNQPTEACDIP
jgi:hypothetical protein